MKTRVIASELVRVARLLRGFKVEITPQYVKKVKLQFAKDIRALEKTINSPEDAAKSAPKWKRLRTVYEKFFYEWILRDHMRELSRGKPAAELGYLENKLQETAWLLVIELRSYELETDPWEDFDKIKKKFFSRLKRRARVAFADAMELAEVQPQTIDFAGQVEVGSFTLVPETAGVTPEEMRSVAKMVESAAGQIKRAGFGKAVQKSMVIQVTTLSKAGLVAAEYMPEKDEMRVRPLGRSDTTIIHEFGHRYYYRIMSAGQRAQWDAVYEGDVFEIQKEDIDLIFSLIDRQHDERLNDRVENALRQYEKVSRDPLAKLKTKQLIFGWLWREEDAEKALKKLRGFWEDQIGEPVMKNEISDYGNTKAEEAFAEAFLHAVIGKRLPSMVDYWLRRVTGT